MSDSREQDKFVLRLPDGLRPKIAIVARTNHRSMNGEIIVRLEHSLSQDRLLADQQKLINLLLIRIESLETAEAVPC